MLRIKNVMGIFSILGVVLSPSLKAQVDPLGPYLWHLGYTGFSGEQPDGHINLGNAHDFFTGDNVVVAVSDSGLQIDHPDLADNIYEGKSKNYNLPHPYFGDPTSTDAHGTVVSGFIGAIKDNGIGVFGVAPNVKLIGLRFLDVYPSIVPRLDQANIPEAHVYNYSYGEMNCQIDPVPTSYINILKNNSHRKNQVYVIAGGNEYLTKPRSFCSNIESDNDVYLANANFDQQYTSPYTIVTAALSRSETRSSYSNPGSNVWISAPGGDLGADNGVGVFSTDLTGCVDGYSKWDESITDLFNNGTSEVNQDCDYTHGQGTSYASPVVAGVVALMKQANPRLTWREIKHILAYTAIKNDSTSEDLPHPLEDDLADHIFDPGWVTNDAGFPFHNHYGFGSVNTVAALRLAIRKNFSLGNWITTELPDGSSLYKTATLNSNIPDGSASGVSSIINVNRHKLVIEHVRVKVNISHVWPSDVGIELTSPSGTKSVLKYINDKMVGTKIDATFASNAFYMERSEGNWTLKIIDGESLVSGKLVSWQLFIDGNDIGTRPTIAAPKVPTKVVAGTGNKITITQASQSNLLRHEACIYVSGSCNEVDWFPLSSLSFTLSRYSNNGTFVSSNGIKKGASYKIAIRAVNTSEKRSSPKVFTLVKN
jgi:subtilisin-like proprotein convertase family protein/subtilisin family serine protease